MIEMAAVTMQPTRLSGLEGPQVWECQAFGTRYRGVVVVLPPSAESVFGMGAELLVAIEPAGGRQGLVPGRMWATFATDRPVLDQGYVEEKFAVRGEDAQAITLLVAAMLGRKASFRAE